MDAQPNQRTKLDVIYHDMLGELGAQLERLETLQQRSEATLLALHELPTQLKDKIVQDLGQHQRGLAQHRQSSKNDMDQVLMQMRQLFEINERAYRRLERLMSRLCWAMGLCAGTVICALSLLAVMTFLK